jgi:hypothetical protein
MNDISALFRQSANHLLLNVRCVTSFISHHNKGTHHHKSGVIAKLSGSESLKAELRGPGVTATVAVNVGSRHIVFYPLIYILYFAGAQVPSNRVR